MFKLAEHVKVRSRLNKRTGERIVFHQYRPKKGKGGFKRNLPGLDPTAIDYQRALREAQHECAVRKSTGNVSVRAKATDENGRRITKRASERYSERFGRDVPLSETAVLWLVETFEKSAQYLSCKLKTLKSHSTLLREVCRQPLPSKGDGALFGDGEFETLKKEDMLKLRQRFAHKAGKADEIVTKLRALFYWAQEQGYMTAINPAAKLGKVRSGKIKMWDDVDQERFEKRFPFGTRQRSLAARSAAHQARVDRLDGGEGQGLEGGEAQAQGRQGAALACASASRAGDRSDSARGLLLHHAGERAALSQ